MPNPLLEFFPEGHPLVQLIDARYAEFEELAPREGDWYIAERAPFKVKDNKLRVEALTSRVVRSLEQMIWNKLASATVPRFVTRAMQYATTDTIKEIGAAAAYIEPYDNGYRLDSVMHQFIPRGLVIGANKPVSGLVCVKPLEVRRPKIASTWFVDVETIWRFDKIEGEVDAWRTQSAIRRRTS